MPVIRVSCSPLVAAPAHEWNTLLAILMQTQAIKTKLVDPEKKTDISLDTGLYQPDKKFNMSLRDHDHLILCPGELHIVTAQLRIIIGDLSKTAASTFAGLRLTYLILLNFRGFLNSRITTANFDLAKFNGHKKISRVLNNF